MPDRRSPRNQRRGRRRAPGRADGPDPSAAGESTPPTGPDRSAPALSQGRNRIEHARDPRGTLRRLASYLLPYRGALLGILSLVLVGVLLDLLAPYLFGLAIDRFIRRGDRAGLVRLSLLLLAVYAASWVASYGQRYAMVSVAQRALRNLRQRLFVHLQDLSLSYYDRHSLGDVLSRFTNDMQVIEQVLSNSVLELANSVLTIIGIVIAMFALNAWLALGAFVIIPVMLYLTTSVARRTRRGFRRVQAELGRLNGIMEENISAARVVQAYGRQQATLAQFQSANTAVRDASIKAQTLAMILPPLLMVLGNVDIAIIAGLGGWLAIRNLATVGTIATFVVYARRFFRPLRSLAELYNAIQSALAGAERIFDSLDVVPRVADRPGALQIDDIQGRVEFADVDFSYVKGVPVLQSVSFVAEPGQTIALVGPTGAGKTTVISLLARFYDVDSGAVLVDKHDVRSLAQDALRRQLGIVLQDTYLFAESVLENIRYGQLEASDEDCMAAARLANADQFIRRLPEGYRTVLSEHGANLSQGQRQLLSIARAMLANPRILILDEATSNVDTRTEARIQDALLKLMRDRTSFVIAHRLSTIRGADQVLVIRDGRIVERGTHQELMEQRGFYYALYMSQFRGAASGEEQAEPRQAPPAPQGGIARPNDLVGGGLPPTSGDEDQVDDAPA